MSERGRIWLISLVTHDVRSGTLGGVCCQTPGIHRPLLLRRSFGIQRSLTTEEGRNIRPRWQILGACDCRRRQSVEMHPPNRLFGQVTGVSGSFYRTMQLGARVDF